MATLYYDFNAPTNGTGTPTSPRNTWATPGNGDVIRIKRGCTWTRSTQLNLSTFTSLTFETYYNKDGSDDYTQPRPIITHTAASTFAWNFQGAGTHTIKNLHFKNCSTNVNGGVLGSGLVAATSKGANLAVENCMFENISHNAIRLSRTGAETADTFSCVNSQFSTVGEDAVYGAALLYIFGHNTVVNVSAFTETGDGVGYLGAVPSLAWVHHNYIDHSSRPFKHCVIIDSSTAGAGFALIEDNVLIGSTGFGPNNVSVINSNARSVIRRNTVFTGRVGISLAGASSKCYSNVLHILESDPGVTAVGITAANIEFYNNTIDNADKTAIAVATSASGTGAVIRNNAVKRCGTFYQRGAVSETLSNNAFEDVNVRYTAGTSSNDLSVVLDKNLRPTTLEAYTSGFNVGYVRDRHNLQSKNHIGAFGRARTA